ncbi:MAG TPA: HTH domain-containing protein [Candidatus Saccharimonadales bacterium]|nr:HTH domain-containing protein [Candidatus Saccharimonadales bacterium]
MAEPSAPTPPPIPVQGAPEHAAPSGGGPGTSVLRRELLVRLRLQGPSSPEQLATALGVSRTGVLQQLHALETAGLVSRQAVRHGVGRPRHVYDVTDAAQDLFPTNYDGLASGLLAAIRALGGEELVSGVFEERRRLTRDRVRQRLADVLPADAPLVDRARELAVIQDEQGYLAEAVVGADGVIRLVERNCAIHRVSAEHAAACQAELDLFRDVLGADVERESHIAAGDRCCTYRIGSSTD